MKFYASVLLLIIIRQMVLCNSRNIKMYNEKCNLSNPVLCMNELTKGYWSKCFEREMGDLMMRRRFVNIGWKTFQRIRRSVPYKNSTESHFTSDVVTVELLRNTSRTQSDLNATVNGNLSHAELMDRFKKTWPLELWKSSGFFDEGYLEFVNVHWLQFPPPAPSVNYTLGALYIVLMIVGCSGNALVMFMYARCRSLRTPGNILVVNLALSDFFMLAKTPVFIINSFYLGPVLGRAGCVLYGFLGGLTGVTTITTLSAIAFDRYYVVVKPLEPLKALNHIRAKLLVVACWVYACIFSIIPALDFGYGRYVPEGFLTSCSFDYLSDDMKPRYFIFVFFCAAWIMPISVITYCYMKILTVVISTRNLTKNSEHRLSTRHVKEQAKRKAEVKLAGLVITVIILFFVSWTPYAIVTLLGIFGVRDIIIPTYSMIPALFCKSAGCINPFIYVMSHPKFKAEFQKIIRKEKRKRSSGTLKTIGYYADAVKDQQKVDGKDISSEEDVEVLEIREIPCHNGKPEDEQNNLPIATVAEKVKDKAPTVSRMSSNNSFDSDVIPPPSWFKKPQFSDKRRSITSSFRNRSTRSTVSAISTERVTT